MTAPASGKRRARYLLPGAYAAFALYAWWDFIHTNPDGLANIGLYLVTLPVTLVGLAVDAVLGTNNSLTPDGHGYIADHALYYFPATAVTALLWWLLGRAIDRRR